MYASSDVISPVTRLTITPTVTRATKPPSKQIAFVSVRDGNSEIYVVNTDGTGLRRISNTPLGDDLPTWSPDGSKIIFATNIKGGAEIRVAKPDGSQQAQLIAGVARIGEIAWSPDGNIIAYHLYTDKVREYTIAFIKSDGTRLEPSLVGHSMVWSPDSQRIAFVADTKVIYSEIYVFNFADYSLTQLTHDSERQFVVNYAPA